MQGQPHSSMYGGTGFITLSIYRAVQQRDKIVYRKGFDTNTREISSQSITKIIFVVCNFGGWPNGGAVLHSFLWLRLINVGLFE